MKNDIKPDITVKINNLTLTCKRCLTRIRTSAQWLFQIETWRGVQVSGRVIRIEGREARIQILGSLQGDKIKSVTTSCKADLTCAGAYRESVILLRYLEGGVHSIVGSVFQSHMAPKRTQLLAAIRPPAAQDTDLFPKSRPQSQYLSGKCHRENSVYFR